ncbi:hypothetical protein ACIP5T_03210 [Microbacterium sp. NPDC088619]|uniref:hypothetical protein n=1 Tax=Microbacterium sp. NPDC088619 TaxID=3364196 RepID=UPI0037FD80B5
MNDNEKIPPTDDEREAMAQIVKDVSVKWGGPSMVEFADTPPIRKHYATADAILAAGFRRSEVPEPSGPWDSATACFGHCDTEGWYSECVSKRADAEVAEPQGEPSDAQVAEIEQRVYDKHRGQIAGMAKALVRAGWDAALRAAGGVR